MARFTVRVELEDAEWKHYNVLYEEMAFHGFTDTIIDTNGNVWKLPDAEYNFVGELNRDEVLSRAKAAAEATRKKFSILVTQSAGRVWHKLKREEN
jgi:hypothetical protein